MSELSILEGEPLAPLVGPFPRRPFLEAWRRHHGNGELRVVVGSGASLPIVLGEGTARLAGESHITDYHSPLGADSGSLVAPLLSLGVTLDFDSLPAEAADPLEKELADAGASVTRTADDVCLVLDLFDPDPDGWEAILRSKDRHEVRRKRRRFDDDLGRPTLEEDPSALGRFVDLHRMAPGAKGGFMTDEMAAFFEDLLTVAGARLDVLRAGSGEVVAAALGFEDDDAYYLYNSAFDPGAADASPGIVLVDRLIQRTADSSRRRFDFLKGAERYKRQLGGAKRSLFRLEVRP